MATRLIDQIADDGLPKLEWKRRALSAERENERLREALQRIRDFDTSTYYDIDTGPGYDQAWNEAGEIAQDALKNTR